MRCFWVLMLLTMMSPGSVSNAAEKLPSECLGFLNRLLPRTDYVSHADAETSTAFRRLEDDEQLWNPLVDQERKGHFPFVVRSPSDQPIQILSLASGLGEDTYLLTSYFGKPGKYLHPETQGPRAYAIEIDIHSNIARLTQNAALRNHSQSESILRSVAHIQGDASLNATFEGLPERFDVVMIRHPDVFSGQYPLEAIFKQGHSRLTKNGVMLITTYFENEYREALARRLGWKV